MQGWRAWRAGHAYARCVRLSIQIGVLAAALAMGTLLALALGAGALGVALTFGQGAFAVTLVALLLRS